MSTKWGNGGVAALTVALFAGAVVAIAATFLASLDRHQGSIRVTGILLFIAGCTRVMLAAVARATDRVLLKFDRSIDQAHRLGQEAAERRRQPESPREELRRLHRRLELVRRS
jgi:hypothetical protein